MTKFKKGDEVQVTSGKDKGKKGKIEKVFRLENKVVVTGINMYKRHRKVSRSQAAGIYEITRPVDIAKIQLVCPKCNKLTKVGIKLEGKTKQRICKKCKGVI
ncbi:50S ribosomal protein L24 [Candidatus Curtissbacteria bacterium]|nr:50S ribosomal protein L24 [Candidatus Curtissbacteria bacterium]